LQKTPSLGFFFNCCFGVIVIHTELETLLTPVVEDLGYELWACEMISQGKYSLLRIYIDKPEGITIDDCERVSHEVSVLLEVQAPLTSQYTLEVSSPGLDRPLFKKAHFQRFLGSNIYVQVRQPIEKCRKFSGELIEVNDDNRIIIRDADVTRTIPMMDIVKAHLIY
jgi:ribosome maturation factor RimP